MQSHCELFFALAFVLRVGGTRPRGNYTVAKGRVSNTLRESRVVFFCFSERFLAELYRNKATWEVLIAQRTEIPSPLRRSTKREEGGCPTSTLLHVLKKLEKLQQQRYHQSDVEAASEISYPRMSSQSNLSDCPSLSIDSELNNSEEAVCYYDPQRLDDLSAEGTKHLTREHTLTSGSLCQLDDPLMVPSTENCVENGKSRTTSASLATSSTPDNSRNFTASDWSTFVRDDSTDKPPLEFEVRLRPVSAIEKPIRNIAF